MAVDFRLLDPQAVSKGVTNANAWADALAKRMAGEQIAANNEVGAEDILNRNGLLGDAMNVRQNVWAEDNRRIAAEDRSIKMAKDAKAEALEAEKREAEVLGTMATNLQSVMQTQGVEAVLPAFELQAKSWLAQGAKPEQIDQMRQALTSNPQQFLAATAGASAAALRRYQLWQQDGSVGTLDTLTGKIDHQYTAPQYKTVSANQNLVEIGGDATGEATPAVNTNPTGAPDIARMRQITRQSESGNRERDASGRLITSDKGAQGAMQVMPGTRLDPGFGVRPAQDDSDAERTRVGDDYLAAMMRRYGNDPAKAWAAYNWGPGNLDNALAGGGDWLSKAPQETRDYVAKNLRALGASGGTGGALPSASRTPRVIAEGPRTAPAGRAQWRNMTAEEASAAGLRDGGSYQINSDGQTRVAQAPASGANTRTNATGGAPKLSPQVEGELKALRQSYRELGNTADLYREWLNLNRRVDTGGMMAMPGAGIAAGAINPTIGRMNAIQAKLTPQMRQGMPGAASDRDVAMFGRATVSIGQTRRANEATARAGIAFSQRQGDYVAFLEQYARDNGTILGATEEWSRYAAENPLFREGPDGMIQVNPWTPWRQYFNRPAGGGGAAPSTPSAPRSGAGTRRRYNPATGRIE